MIEYLKEHHRGLRQQLGERRRLAMKCNALGGKMLWATAGILTPDTILRWSRQLVDRKVGRSKRASPRRRT